MDRLSDLIEYSDAQSWVDIFLDSCARNPSKVALDILGPDLESRVSLSYKQLLDKCSAVAGFLREHAEAGARVLLCLSQGEKFIISFIACLMAEVVAVPVKLPSRKELSRGQFLDVVRNCGASFVLTESQVFQNVFSAEPLSVEVLCYESAENNSWSLKCNRGAISAKGLAFLQYTSGSTSDPKGVQILHGNLLANQKAISQIFNANSDSVIVSWLPMFHDLGLSTILGSMFWGGRCVFMAPELFSKTPVLWLKAISLYRGTISGAPDFAYRFLVEKVRSEDKDSLDLSCWRVAFDAAEPIRAKTLEDFSKSFASAGFNFKAFTGGYGMAEAVVGVSFGSLDEVPSIIRVDEQAFSRGSIRLAGKKTTRHLTFVSSGHPLVGTEIKIAVPGESVEVADGHVGEICIKSRSVAAGYWCNKSDTASAFNQVVSGVPGFYRSNDLGFLWEGQLYVTGRLKDLIIIRGRNIVPTDIESTMSAQHDAFQNVYSAAVAVDIGGEESVVCIQEINRSWMRRPEIDLPETSVEGSNASTDIFDFEKLGRKVATSIVGALGVMPMAVIFVKPLSLPRTTSGKVQRQLIKEQYLKKKLAVVGEWARSKPLLVTVSGVDLVARRERLVHKYIAEQEVQDGASANNLLRSYVRLMLCIAASDESLINISNDAGFFEAGLDSLQVMMLVEQIEADLGVHLSGHDFFNASCVSSLALLIDQRFRLNKAVGETCAQEIQEINNFSIEADCNVDDLDELLTLEFEKLVALIR